MHRTCWFIAALLGLSTLIACSRPAPPSGRWQGSYESADVMVVARLEIDPHGEIFLSAPDLTGIAATPSDSRGDLRSTLVETLDSDWAGAQPRRFDFDGHTFRKPGGLAPQLEWDGSNMTAVIYLGLRPSIRVPLHAVASFDDNLWNG